jgi:hypothetical protein
MEQIASRRHPARLVAGLLPNLAACAYAACATGECKLRHRGFEGAMSGTTVISDDAPVDPQPHEVSQAFLAAIVDSSEDRSRS